jgi:hypothetical protein
MLLRRLHQALLGSSHLAVRLHYLRKALLLFLPV